MSTIPPLWEHQEFAISEVDRLIAAGETKILVTAPTGAGKARIICELIAARARRNEAAILYTNRKLLIEQLAGVLRKNGIEFGLRASGHRPDLSLDVQISSLPTENVRTLKNQTWDLHGRGKACTVFIDEAHLNKSNTAIEILGMHHDRGDAYIGFTATPVALGHLYDKMIVAGIPSELRKIKCLVPAYHFGPDEPDMSGFKQSVKTGEYSYNDIRKAIMTKRIFGSVLEHYRLLNPAGVPSILFAPGVAESIWFAEQLSKEGIPSAHIDGEGVWVDGKFFRKGNRKEIIERLKEGNIKLLANRFVLREGIDVPEIGHLILATVMGSKQTYIQSVGRGLRWAPGKTRLTLVDHGGHWWRHGSVNIDQQWDMNQTEAMIAAIRKDRLEKSGTEPILCIKCKAIRAAGPVCPLCGFESKQNARIVIQSNGVLVQHRGRIFKEKRRRLFNDTLTKWKECYFRAKKSKNQMTFNQAIGLFVYENKYWPPENLPLMPKLKLDWFLKVKDIPPDRLYGELPT